MDSFRPIKWALAALAAFAASFVVIGLDGWGEPAANESPIGEISRWCERVSGGLLREPVNTLGNLAFVVAGLAIFWVLARDTERGSAADNDFVGNQPIALLYASAVVFLGPGSMVMHGTHTRFGAWIDNVSMVVYILIPWLYNLMILGGWSRRRFFSVYAALAASYAAGYWFIGPDLGIGLELFAISIPLWLISESLVAVRAPWFRWASGLVGFATAAVFGTTPPDMVADPGEHWWVVLFWLPAVVMPGQTPVIRRHVPWFWAGVVAFLAAYAIWLTGTDTSQSCDPDSLLQPHAVWHVLSAVATWCFFLFLRTQRDRSGFVPSESWSRR